MRRILCISACALIAVVSDVHTAEHNAAEAAFSRLKALTGEWEGRAPEIYGDAIIRLSYRLVSDDSVLLETFRIDAHDLEMVTVYHIDGQQLALTHYCAVNNQVRMLADLAAIKKGAEIRTISFAFRDGSNLDGGSQVMNRLSIIVEDDKHFTQLWRWRDKKSPTGEGSATYRYTRVR